MLDHLNAHHLAPASSAGPSLAQEITTADAVHAPESDDVVADLERAFRRSSRPRHRLGSVTSAIVALLLLIASVVAFLALLV